jgi:hypothetical protein
MVCWLWPPSSWWPQDWVGSYSAPLAAAAPTAIPPPSTVQTVAEAEASEAVAQPIRAADITGIRTARRTAVPQGVDPRAAGVAEGAAGNSRA